MLEQRNELAQRDLGLGIERLEERQHDRVAEVEHTAELGEHLGGAL